MREVEIRSNNRTRGGRSRFGGNAGIGCRVSRRGKLGLGRERSGSRELSIWVEFSMGPDVSVVGSIYLKLQPVQVPYPVYKGLVLVRQIGTLRESFCACSVGR